MVVAVPLLSSLVVWTAIAAGCGSDEAGGGSGEAGSTVSSSGTGAGGDGGIGGSASSSSPSSSSTSIGGGGRGGEGGEPNPCANVPPAVGIIECGSATVGAGGSSPESCVIMCDEGVCETSLGGCMVDGDCPSSGETCLHHTYESVCAGTACTCSYDGQPMCSCDNGEGSVICGDLFVSCCP